MWFNGDMPITTDNPKYRFLEELSDWERGCLSDASKPLGDFALLSQGEQRFCFYRRRGYTTAECIEFALNWCRNAAEQAERRLSHDTGAIRSWGQQ
jgi:hypothetical protein